MSVTSLAPAVFGNAACNAAICRVMRGHGPPQRVKMMSATQAWPRRSASVTGCLELIGEREIGDRADDGQAGIGVDRSGQPRKTELRMQNDDEADADPDRAGKSFRCLIHSQKILRRTRVRRKAKANDSAAG